MFCSTLSIPLTEACVLQGRQALQGGVGRAEELEEDVDPKLARSFLGEPDKLLNLDTPLMKKIKQ